MIIWGTHPTLGFELVSEAYVALKDPCIGHLPILNGV
jgi:hypothetical protein